MKNSSVGKKWIFIIILMIAFIVSIGLFLGVKLQRADSIAEEDILRKIPSIKESGVYSASDVGLIRDQILSTDSNLKKDVYYAEEFFADIVPGEFMTSVYNTGSYYGFLKNLVGHYPTRNIREVPGETEKYYLVYLLSNGGRVFMFNDRAIGYGYAVYSEKALSFADFSDVKVGDNIKKVTLIDSAVAQYIKVFDSYTNRPNADDSWLTQFINDAHCDGFDPFSSIHLLKDGLLLIIYDPVAKASGYTYTVKEVEFFDDYVLPDYYYIYNEDYFRANHPEYQPRRYPMRVLAKDLPGETLLLADDSIPETAEPEKASDAEWKIEVKVSENGSLRSTGLTRKDVERAFPLSRIITSRFEENNPEYSVNTIIAEGIPLRDLLRLIGAEKAVRIVAVGADGTEREISKKKWEEHDGHLIWIENNDFALRWSEAKVAIAFTDADPFSYIPSVVSLRIFIE